MFQLFFQNIPQTVWPHWGVLTVIVSSWFVWGSRPWAESGWSVSLRRPTRNASREVKIYVSPARNGGSEIAFRISHWEAGVKVWLEVCFFAISYWEADVQVWLELWFFGVSLWRGTDFMFANATICGFPACRIAFTVAPCRFWMILVHLVASPRLWTLRHASGDMDLLAESQVWTPETWILLIWSTDMDAGAWQSRELL